MLKVKEKPAPSFRVYFKEQAGTKTVQKSFVCPENMLKVHLKEVQKINTDVRYERVQA